MRNDYHTEKKKKKRVNSILFRKTGEKPPLLNYISLKLFIIFLHCNYNNKISGVKKNNCMMLRILAICLH